MLPLTDYSLPPSSGRQLLSAGRSVTTVFLLAAEVVAPDDSVGVGQFVQNGSNDIAPIFQRTCSSSGTGRWTSAIDCNRKTLPVASGHSMSHCGLAALAETATGTHAPDRRPHADIQRTHPLPLREKITALNA